MNREYICSCLAEAGYDAGLADDSSSLTLGFEVGGRRISLIHQFPSVLLRVPVFHLVDGYAGKLAHVGGDRNGGGREVCIADAGSMAVNTDRPELAYLETVRKHVARLTRLIQDPEYNRVEQLREFDAHWSILCREERGQVNELFVAWDGQKVEGLEVRPPRSTSGSELRKTHVAMANVGQPASVCRVAGWGQRPTVGVALGVRLRSVEPAPATREELLAWFFSAIGQVDPAGRREWRRLEKKRRPDYWLVFSAPIPDGETMFAIRWQSRSKGRLPGSEAEVEAGRWTVTPYRVRSLSRESLVPRGGGSLDLRTKSVLLVGCGSVGSELALLLTSAGVGRLTVSDPETFSEENLYRHVLSLKGRRPVQDRGARGRNGREAPVGGSGALEQAAGRVASDGATGIHPSGDRHRFADGRAGLCGLLSPRILGRAGNELLAGGRRNRRTCDPGGARGERMLALRLRGPQEAQARTHVKPELSEAGAGRDAQPQGLRHAIPALQRDRGKLHGDNGCGPGRALSRG